MNRYGYRPHGKPSKITCLGYQQSYTSALAQAHKRTKQPVMFIIKDGAWAFVRKEGSNA